MNRTTVTSQFPLAETSCQDSDTFGKNEVVKKFEGDLETTRVVVGCFLLNFPRHVDFIRGCIPFGNWLEAARLARASWGAAAYVEAGKIRNILSRLEVSLLGRRREESEEILLLLEKEFLRFREAVANSGMATDAESPGPPSP